MVPFVLSRDSAGRWVGRPQVRVLVRGVATAGGSDGPLDPFVSLSHDGKTWTSIPKDGIEVGPCGTLRHGRGVTLVELDADATEVVVQVAHDPASVVLLCDVVRAPA